MAEAENNPASFCGDISPKTAWAFLEKEPSCHLIDVRSEPEWMFSGIPDLSTLGKKAHLISWQIFPSMALNSDFAEIIEGAGFSKEDKLLFLCRSGARSGEAARLMAAKGFSHCYNIEHGFEGPRDSNSGRRGCINGWKCADLPWNQS